jgi:hypothetical protein
LGAGRSGGDSGKREEKSDGHMLCAPLAQRTMPYHEFLTLGHPNWVRGTCDAGEVSSGRQEAAGKAPFTQASYRLRRKEEYSLGTSTFSITENANS